MQLNDLEIYNEAMDIAESIYNCVQSWDSFAKNTIGSQWIRAVDSIAANISEGYGRFHYKENKRFCFYARGSLFETVTWAKKAHDRALISKEQHEQFKTRLTVLSKRLNQYIKSIGEQNTVHENGTPY